MKLPPKYSFILILLFSAFFPHRNALTQVVPDDTLGQENSTINSIDELNDRIEGGAIRDRNLFHSFQELNVTEGRGVYFDNPEGIANIFSRVTGSNSSEVFGTLGVLGNANLFLINPNGIIFGENAALDVRGSFVATTADRIQFEDGTNFAAREGDEKPILTVSVPIGLGFGSNPGAIQVNGRGHNLILNTADRTFRFPAFSSLNVDSGNTLALIGGDIIFDGGVVVAEDGHLELGAVAAGQVKFDSSNLNNFQYDVSQLRNISFDNLALADASGSFGGSIDVVANNVSFQSGSGLFVQNSEQRPDNSIEVNANSIDILGGAFVPALTFSDRGFIELSSDSQAVKGGILDGVLISPNQSIEEVLASSGLSIDEAESITAFLPSFIFSESLQNGQGKDINVSTQKLLISNGSQLITRSFNAAQAGNISVDAATTSEVTGASNTPGFAEQNFEIFSQINSSTFGSGTGGDIGLDVDNLLTSDGGSINSTSNGAGKGGNIDINATTIDLVGSVPNVFLPSSIAAGTANEGDAGNLTINTSNIYLRDGAAISTSTLASGNAGEIEIYAADLIEITGIDSNTGLPSAITSGGGLLPPEIQEAFRLPPFPTGNAGSLFVSASEIQLNNAGQINVTNLGTGDAGQLQIDSNNIKLNNAGAISASTLSGQGGNIVLNTEGLELFDRGQISATAGEAGNGGNLSINTTFLIADENSEITANAFQGSGGNISIDAEGLFLFNSPENIFSASSELGIDGEIQIDTPEIDLQKELEQSELEILTAEQAIANSCLARSSQQGSFTINDNGGLPKNPNSNYSDADFSLTGVSRLTTTNQPSEIPENSRQQNSSAIPAQKMVETRSGRIFLVAAPQKAESLYCKTKAVLKDTASHKSRRD